MSSSDYEGQFLTNNYTIQINILYNTKDTKEGEDANDDTSDDLGNNYYIINNMKDILLNEFSNEKRYQFFKDTYANTDSSNPIYMINDSFYLDTNVMNTIRKITSDKFPNYNSSNIGVRKQEIITNFEKFISNSNLQDKNAILKIFKETFIKLISDARVSRKNNEEIQNIIGIVNPIRSLEDLFNNESFRNETTIGTREFHATIKTKYDTTQDTRLKKALQSFYNISSNNLANKSKYEYFLKPETITNIFKVIYENSNNEESIYGRKPSLNDNRTKEEIYNKYFKYVFPNKKDITNLSDPDKDTILMFYNIYYIIKNIYLLDNTIIKVTNYRIKKNKEEKKYYISQVSLLDLKDNITHFRVEKNKVIIFIKATLKYIIENPILQINYLIDDLENARQNFLPQSYILQPKDINNNYSSYNKIYIHNKVKYIDNVKIIDEIVAASRKKDFIKNKDELFLNTKALKLFNKFFKAKINSASHPDEDKIIESNIKYLLHKIFKFYNNKEFKKYYIADTYIQYFNDLSKYYSITKGTIEDNSEKYEIISTLFQESSVSEEEVAITTSGPIAKRFYKEIKSSDARLDENKIYKVNLVFRCYSDKTGNKPTFIRKIVAEKCLSRAQKLDEAFSNSLYKTFNLPENYLYNKLANITRKQTLSKMPESKMPENKMPENKMPENKMPESKMPESKMPENKINPFAPQENIDLIVANKRGGRATKKYYHNKNMRLKYKNIANVKIY